MDNKTIRIIDILNKSDFAPRKMLRKVKMNGKRDEYSTMQHSELSACLDDTTCNKIYEAFPDDTKNQKDVMKWTLRGLNVDMSIKKVQIQIEACEKIKRKNVRKNQTC